eukprot:CAMPEP_0177418660 /NCGR_PEP_ID=MMETSP0368-20130122/69298_1 /TAXON_ID=447022 ORGANISM="Scrippsiella hangoei-like, Strain SHHI-4" /NCGR_SAMPLE_ID=MMETSP0368 /ASSEMBLY_ACC=CAM_ASM_000363 /LENGTH=41 /DNA_ID= /DNA_START= /DNA_END= /DNA_ORIENTATION=
MAAADASTKALSASEACPVEQSAAPQPWPGGKLWSPWPSRR